ncbi:uncharacterized protein [Solanum lycopersicum]|uniref:uncharacterized protein n=1 Tax=Solanum lycopersicum TaxID=4081 RepID=UPI00374A9468
MSVLNHLDKANVVVDAISGMTVGSVSHVEEAKKDLVKDVHRLARLGVILEDSSNVGFLVHHNSESSLVVEVDGVLRYQGRLCVPNIDSLRNKILEEAHGSRYSIHPSSTKMYHYFRKVFWWEYIKKDIAECAAKCQNCQRVKADNKIRVVCFKKSKFLHGNG